MRRALRQAELYGYLIGRTNRLYHLGGNVPVCSAHVGQEMAQAGWLIEHDVKYQITPEGRLAAEA